MVGQRVMNTENKHNKSDTTSLFDSLVPTMFLSMNKQKALIEKEVVIFDIQSAL